MIGMRCGQKRIRGACVSWSCSVKGWKLKVCTLRLGKEHTKVQKVACSNVVISFHHLNALPNDASVKLFFLYREA